MSTQTLSDKILSRIYGKKRGLIFTQVDFRDLGNDFGIRKVLQNLCNRGVIIRIARGVYLYPQTHPKLGVLSPTPNQIALALAGKGDLRIQPAGAYAANLLGLSEQVPAKIIFLTDGANRKIKVGKQEIIFKQTTPKNMATAGRTSGLVIQALRYLGRDHVDDAIVDTLARRLSPDDRHQLIKDVRHAPAWIGAIFRHLSERNG